MSDYFSNARDFALNNPNFNHVGRDQNIHHHTTTITAAQSKSRLWIQGTEEEEGEFEQYYEVKRADVELKSFICDSVPHKLQEQWEFDCVTTFFTGEIPRGNVQSSGVMVVTYEGREAQKAWLEGFKMCTGFLSVNSAHLLAINRSRIPLLIFTRALVPAAQFLVNVRPLGRAYFDLLSEQLGCGWKGSPRWEGSSLCDERNVWMDPQKGILCRGLEGPPCLGVGGGVIFSNVKHVPSSVELLQEDIFLRFLAGLKSEAADRNVVAGLPPAWLQDSIDSQFNRPTVISSLTNTSIASGATRWDGSGVDGVLLGNGQTSFTLDDFSTSTGISLRSDFQLQAWLPQAWSIFYALDVSLEEDLSQYELIVPEMRFFLSLSRSPSKYRRRRRQPIFLFIRPLPSTPALQSCSTIPSLHHWSFNKDGNRPLSTTVCRHLGLPVTIEISLVSRTALSWSNETYKMMHEYQVARGFDPSTTDFAQSLGFPAYEPIQNDSDRLEELEGRNSDYMRPSSPPVLYRSLTPDESDVDTDCDYSDTDDDADAIFFSSDDEYVNLLLYDGYSDDSSDFSGSESSWLTTSDSESEMDDVCVRFGDLILD